MKRLQEVYCFFLIVVCLSCQLEETVPVPIDPLNTKPLSVNSTLPDAELSNFEIIGYLPYWGLAHYTEYDLQYKNLTTLVMLATISKDGVQDSTKNGLIWGDSDKGPDPYYQPPLANMIAYMRFINPNLKIFLGLSDLHDTPTSRAESAELFNSTNRSNTIDWLMTNYVDSLDFDGVDVDFEDASLDPGYIYDNYPLFIKDLSIALHNSTARGREKLCTASLGNDWNRTNVITNDFRNHVDLLGFQTYSSEKMDYLMANPYRDVKASLAGWTGTGQMPKNKLALGLAAWSIYVNSSGTHVADTYSYYELLKLPPVDTVFLPYLTTSLNTHKHDQSGQLRFSGMYETRRKLEWAENEQIKGVFIWDISKDAGCDFSRYSLIEMLNHAHSNPTEYDNIVGYTTQDFYSSAQSISVGFHSLPPSSTNWVGVYELHSGQSTGYFQYLPNSASGTVTIPSSLTSSLTSNTLYILRFYEGAGGVGNTLHGTSHPFYKL